MSHIEKKGRLKGFAVTVFLSLFALGLLFDPKGCGIAAQSGIVLSIETVIPSLFPFFVLSTIIMKLNTSNGIGTVAKHTVCRLFRINTDLGCAYLLGVIGGYPVGAKNVCAVYRCGGCSKKEAERAISFSNNCGPAFILSVVGIYLFDSVFIGVTLYLIHIISSAVIAVILRPKKQICYTKSQNKYENIPFSKIFVTAVKDSTISIANVCSFLVIFAVLIHILEYFHVFSIIHINSQLLTATLKGLIEVTGGIREIGNLTPTPLSVIVCSFLLGFGGICVHCQTSFSVSNTDISMKLYFISKIAQGIIAALLTWLSLSLFPAFFDSVIITSQQAFNLNIPIYIVSISSVFIFIFCTMRKRIKKVFNFLQKCCIIDMRCGHNQIK